MTHTTIDLASDVIDLRDITARFEELEIERDTLAYEYAEAHADPKRTHLAEEKAINDWDDENGDELNTLRSILDDLKGYGGDEQWRGDWYPITLIRESYFTEYSRDLISDIGDLPRDIPSYIEIDWEATASNLKVDYSDIEINGATYFYR